MAYLDDLKRFSVDGIVLPYQRIRVRGGQRDHVHEFPYVPGGLPELFGRKLYEIDVSIRIDDAIMRAGGYYRGRNLYTNLNVLQGRWEDGRRMSLYLPNIGEIQGYAVDWERDLDVRVRSGETCEVKFREDQDQANLVMKTLSNKPVAAVAQKLGALEATMPVPPPSIFDQIRNAVNQLLAIRDQAQMWTDFVAVKIAGLLALFREADETLDLLLDPQNHEMLEAMHALWASVQEMQTEAGTIETYTTTRDMDAASAAQAIYGTTAEAVSIMNLNALEDPYRIPAGTALKYLKAA
jgi:hypothetical protein